MNQDTIIAIKDQFVLREKFCQMLVKLMIKKMINVKFVMMVIILLQMVNNV